MSTAVFWCIPAWATSYNDIYLFIKKYCEGQENEVDPIVLKEVYDELQLKERFGMQECKPELVLKLPFYFLENFMEKTLELAAALEERAHQLTAGLTESSPPRQRRIAYVVGVERRQLEGSVAQLNSVVELLGKADSSSMAVNRDNSVLKYNSVLRGYEGVERGRRRWMMRFAFRVKLICRWRRLQKKRAERLL